MSKKFSSVLALLALVCLVAGSFLPAAVGQTATSRSVQNAAIVSTADAVLKETSELRELSILRGVKSGAQSPAPARAGCISIKQRSIRRKCGMAAA